MKRLVLLGEGHGEVAALPVLVKRLLQEKDAGSLLYVDREVVRTNPSQLVRWNKPHQEPNYAQWISRVTLAARRRDVGGVLAVFDGDFKKFPAGSPTPFCAATAAKSMAATASTAGAGKMFSLCVVFACSEYETWLVAGAESLAGTALPAGTRFPEGDPESHGKGWLEAHCDGYRPTRDQAALTERVNLDVIRSKKLRSFQRLEHAIEQIVEAVANGRHISTPC